MIDESQVNLMSQPRLLKYICNVPGIFPEHAEIHRHVARCLANLALYGKYLLVHTKKPVYQTRLFFLEENNKAMLTNKRGTKDGNKDSYNVLPILLFMGKSDAQRHVVQRHIVRAIDNLSSNSKYTVLDVPFETNILSSVRPKDIRWKELFSEACLYIRKVLDEYDGNEKDVDTIKRAKGIIARERLENEFHPAVKTVVSAIEKIKFMPLEKEEAVTTPIAVVTAPTTVIDPTTAIDSTTVTDPSTAIDPTTVTNPTAATDPTTVTAPEVVTEEETMPSDEVSSLPISEDDEAVIVEEGTRSDDKVQTSSTEAISNDHEAEEPKSAPQLAKNKKKSRKHKKIE